MNAFVKEEKKALFNYNYFAVGKKVTVVWIRLHKGVMKLKRKREKSLVASTCFCPYFFFRWNNYPQLPLTFITKTDNTTRVEKGTLHRLNALWVSRN